MEMRDRGHAGAICGADLHGPEPYCHTIVLNVVTRVEMARSKTVVQRKAFFNGGEGDSVTAIPYMESKFRELSHDSSAKNADSLVESGIYDCGDGGTRTAGPLHAK